MGIVEKEQNSKPQLRFPEFKESWKAFRLGEIGRVSMCKRVLKHQTHTSGDIPFYTIGTFGKDAGSYISKDLYDNFRTKYPFPKKGDILISAAGTIGRLVVYDGAPAYFQDSNIVWIDNDERRVSNDFLLYCYKNIKWKTEDTTIARLYNDNLRDTKSSTPSLPEQQKIAGFLGSVDEWLDNLRQQKTALETYKRGMMQKLFTQQIRFKDEDGKNYPEWTAEELGSVCNIKTGKKDVNQGNPNGKYPFFTCAKQHTYSDGYSFDCDAILIAGNGEVGHSQKYSGKFEAYQRTYVLSDFSVSYNYVWTVVKTLFEDYVTNQTQKGAMPYIKLGTLKSFPVPLPVEAEQQKIADFLSAINQTIAAKTEEITKVEQWKKGLMQKMFV